ncbi:MAG: hypothetical protein IPP43_03815 [Chitinophagaceae bacterium]|nr:hypothetical protein [Chitinophagaceae bacterium]
MRKLSLLSVLLYITTQAYSQIDSTIEKDLEEAVVYSNKFIEKKKIWHKKLM